MPLTKTDYVFFWREGAANGWASQWYHSPFRTRIHVNIDIGRDTRTIESEEEHTFPTAEHWMMACKALLFDDQEVFEKIVNAEAYDMRGVKQLGREVRGFEEAVWNVAREVIVVQGNLHKFRQNEELKEELLATGDKILVEASPRDRIWGVGYGEKRALEMKDSWGLNLLGKALQEVRTTLRQEAVDTIEART